MEWTLPPQPVVGERRPVGLALWKPTAAAMHLPPVEPMELPVAPSDPRLAAAEAAEAPILRQLTAVGEYLGAGLSLTRSGYPTVEDGRRLVELFNSGDTLDLRFGDRDVPLRSTAGLFNLGRLLRGLIRVGALTVRGNRLEGVPAFVEREPLEQVRPVFQILSSRGWLASGTATLADVVGGECAFLVELVVETGLAEWLTPLVWRDVLAVEEWISMVSTVMAATTEGVLPSWLQEEPECLAEDLVIPFERMLDVLERCGVVRRSGDRLEPDRLGGFDRRGGTVQLTELGRVLLRPVFEAAGYRVVPAAERRP